MLFLRSFLESRRWSRNGNTAAKGSVASYFSVRRFVIGFIRHGPARRWKTGVNILRRDECSSAAVETSIRILRGLIYDYANARNMKKVQTIMFPRSFLLPVLGENTDFINAIWLVWTFFTRLWWEKSGEWKITIRHIRNALKVAHLLTAIDFLTNFE